MKRERERGEHLDRKETEIYEYRLDENGSKEGRERNVEETSNKKSTESSELLLTFTKMKRTNIDLYKIKLFTV